MLLISASGLAATEEYQQDPTPTTRALRKCCLLTPFVGLSSRLSGQHLALRLDKWLLDKGSAPDQLHEPLWRLSGRSSSSHQWRWENGTHRIDARFKLIHMHMLHRTTSMRMLLFGAIWTKVPAKPTWCSWWTPKAGMSPDYPL